MLFKVDAIQGIQGDVEVAGFVVSGFSGGIGARVHDQLVALQAGISGTKHIFAVEQFIVGIVTEYQAQVAGPVPANLINEANFAQVIGALDGFSGSDAHHGQGQDQGSQQGNDLFHGESSFIISTCFGRSSLWLYCNKWAISLQGVHRN